MCAPVQENEWLLWQLADSAFPSGGFAHSGGLEAAAQHGELRNAAELTAFIEASLCQLGHASLPFVTAAHGEPASLPELDSLCESYTTNHVANRASRLQGRALLASAQRIFDLAELQGNPPFVAQPLSYCHLAPVFGFVTNAVGVRREAAARLFFFIHLRGLMAGAVRLGLVGPLQAQALQHNLGPRAEAIRRRCETISLDELAQTSPLLELWQATHDRLYSRLFQS